jgi:hypothetical protein
MVQDLTKVGIQQSNDGPIDPLTQLIREVRGNRDHPVGKQLVTDRLTGQAPIGVDAPSLGARKLIADSYTLLHTLQLLAGTLFSLVIGADLIWLSFRATGFDWKFFSIGTGLLLLGLWLGRNCKRGFRELRAISKA